MPEKKTEKPNVEQTSAAVASIAGRILNNADLRRAEEWLRAIADSSNTNDVVRSHAFVLLGALESARRVAGSALTQR